MTRIFWDTMLFIYLLEDNPKYFKQVNCLLERSYKRGDELYTSCLAVGEVMAGASDAAGGRLAQDVIVRMGFRSLAFDENCMQTFGCVRSEFGIKAPDAIHLACAAAAGIDLFLTGDKGLLKKRPRVPGIQFIADFEYAPL